METSTEPSTLVLIGGLGALPALWRPMVTALGGRIALEAGADGLLEEKGRRWRIVDRGPGVDLTTEVGDVIRLLERSAGAAEPDVPARSGDQARPDSSPRPDSSARLDVPARGVIVAHSMGAFVAEAVARTRPDLVSHVVLLDPSVEHETQRRSATQTARTQTRGPSGRPQPRPGLRPRSPAARRHGPAARCARAVLAMDVAGRVMTTVRRLVLDLPPDVAADVDAALGDAGFRTRLVTEWAAYPDLARELETLRRERPGYDAATLLVTASRRRRATGWYRRHARYAALLGATHVLVAPSGHAVMLDRPDTCATLIDDRLGARRAGPGPPHAAATPLR